MKATQTVCWWLTGICFMASIITFCAGFVVMAIETYDGMRISTPFLEWLAMCIGMGGMAFSMLFMCIGFVVMVLEDAL